MAWADSFYFSIRREEVGCLTGLLTVSTTPYYACYNQH